MIITKPRANTEVALFLSTFPKNIPIIVEYDVNGNILSIESDNQSVIDYGKLKGLS